MRSKQFQFNTTVWQRVAQELRPGHLFRPNQIIPTIVSSCLIGLMTTILSVSFAVLVFGAVGPEALAIGIGMALVSNIILHIASAITSSAEGVISHVQSMPPPIQATMLASMMALLPTTLSAENRVTVAVVTILLSAIFTGVTLYLFGHFKFGRLVRFLPYPVIGGVLAAVGVSLLFGGISTMTSQSVTPGTLPSFFSPQLLSQWLPGVLLAVVVILVLAKWHSPVALPTLLAGACALFFLIAGGMGLNQADLLDKGWLLGPFAEGRLWQPPSAQNFLTFDWHILQTQLGTLLTIPLVCLIGGLLMLSAIEVSTNQETQPDFELKTMGLTNVVSGLLGGGFIGYPSATFTMMQHSLGASTRLVGLLSSLVSAVVLLLGANVLSALPRFIIGGLLIYFGYQFIAAWAIQPAKQAPIADKAIIFIIVFTSVTFGFVQAVGVGLVVAMGLFLVNYSQTTVVRHALSRATRQSRLTRNSAETEWLAQHGDQISIFILQGYLFFGTAHSLVENILARVKDATQSPVDSIILDFQYVTGIDTSVVRNFEKLYENLSPAGVRLVFSQLSPKFESTLQHGGFNLTEQDQLTLFSDFDAALEHCEEKLLATWQSERASSPSLNALFAERVADPQKVDKLIAYFERLEIAVGDRLIDQGAAADDLFFIESGRLTACLEQANQPPVRLQTMLADTLVGEIGLYLGQSRGATVIADEESVVFRLSAESLTNMETNDPDLAILLHRLVVEKTAQRVNHLVNSVSGLLKG